ncbi:RodZ domain-containing protein [Salibacterium salarium]|uniref:RodZ domain-containing protein n=1 Tax=Salibacterium salarium TaxID=284579 RepID=UPI0035226B84
MQIELQIDGNSYIDIKDEEGATLEESATFKEESTFELDFSDEEYVKVNIGNTSVVTLYFNGEEIDYPVDNAHQHIIFDKQP